MYEPDDDKESLNDKILEMLGGEVDDYAAEQLPDEEKPEGSTKGGVEISIIVTPKSGGEAKTEEEGGEEEEGEHDEIAHALGMHDGGCVY